MDYEKLYNEALERAKYCLTTDMDNSGHWAVKHIFPELKESEDERIRKALLEHIKGIRAWNYFLGISKEQMISWLEKQGDIVKHYEDKLDKCDCDNFNKGYEKSFEKQGEKY